MSATVVLGKNVMIQFIICQTRSQNLMKLGFLVAEKNVDKQTDKINKILPHPFKRTNSKIRLRHVLSWPKLGLEPKFHEAGLLVAMKNVDKQTYKIHIL